MGYFAEAFDGLLREFGRGDIFALVAADAGRFGRNGCHVRDADRHYLFRLKNTCRLAHRGARTVAWQPPWPSPKRGRVQAVRLPSATLPDRRDGRLRVDHLRTVLRIEWRGAPGDRRVVPMKEEDGSLLPLEPPAGELRLRNGCCGAPLLGRRERSALHSRQDYGRDDHPWIVNDPQGMVVALLLRRIAYNLLALFAT